MLYLRRRILQCRVLSPSFAKWPYPVNVFIPTDVGLCHGTLAPPDAIDIVGALQYVIQYSMKIILNTETLGYIKGVDIKGVNIQKNLISSA